MIKGLLAAAASVLMTSTAYAQMDGNQGGGMMNGGGSGWGMGYYSWASGTILVIFVVLIVAYIVKRK